MGFSQIAVRRSIQIEKRESERRRKKEKEHESACKSAKECRSAIDDSPPHSADVTAHAKVGERGYRNWIQSNERWTEYKYIRGRGLSSAVTNKYRHIFIQVQVGIAQR